MRVPGWHCFAASRFSIVLAGNVLCPLRSSSDSHVPGVQASRCGEELWNRRKSGKCVWDTRAPPGGWRLNSQGGRNRELEGESGILVGGGGLVGGESELPQNPNKSKVWEIPPPTIQTSRPECSFYCSFQSFQ